MKTTLLILMSSLLLAACTNTRDGVTRDSEDFSRKIQETSAIWTQ